MKLLTFIFALVPTLAFAQDKVDQAPTIPIEILGWVMATLALLTTISKFLAFVAVKTANTYDNKVADILSKVLGLAGKLIDTFTANERPATVVPAVAVDIKLAKKK